MNSSDPWNLCKKVQLRLFYTGESYHSIFISTCKPALLTASAHSMLGQGCQVERKSADLSWFPARERGQDRACNIQPIHNDVDRSQDRCLMHTVPGVY